MPDNENIINRMLKKLRGEQEKEALQRSNIDSSRAEMNKQNEREISENLKNYLSGNEGISGRTSSARDELERNLSFVNQYVQAWETARSTPAGMEKDSKENAFVDFKEHVKNGPVHGDDGYLEVLVKNNGDVDILNKENDKKGFIHIDFNTGKITTKDEGQAMTDDEKTVADSYSCFVVENKGKDCVPERDEIKTRLEKAIEKADESPDKKASFYINNTEYMIASRGDKYDIKAVETSKEERELMLVNGKRLTKEELLSEESLEKIRKSAGAAELIKADKFCEREETIRKEVVHSDPDQYVVREDANGEKKYILNDPEFPAYASESHAAMIDAAESIDNKRLEDGTNIGEHADNVGFTTPYYDEQEEEEDYDLPGSRFRP